MIAVVNTSSLIFHIFLRDLTLQSRYFGSMDDQGWLLLPLTGFDRAHIPTFAKMDEGDLDELKKILLYALSEPDTDARFNFLCRLQQVVMSVPDVSEGIIDAIAKIRGGRNRDIQLTIDRIQAVQHTAAADAFLDTILHDSFP